MMIPTGNALKAATLWLLLTMSPALFAAVDASVDRREVALGDTLQLVISATEEDEELSGIDFGALEPDFQVLGRSTRSNTSIVNGKRSHNRQLQLEITPLRTGRLTIPSFTVGPQRTAPITVNVGEAPQPAPGDEAIIFEATVDTDTVYVQGQILLTLRLQQAVNLDDRSISELTLPNAFVVPLEQNSFQRRIDGRPWLVHEVRYAIFPEQSGTLTIPAQQFTARESSPRRSLFDSNRGRMVRLASESLQIEVLPKPDAFPGSSWLPARNVVVEEDWSTDPQSLRVGESVTRTIRLQGEGVQGAQLPPVLFTPIDGIKHYPDQPAINDDEISSGLLGSRRDSVAIVPTRAGSIALPAVEIPWWDTQAGALRKVVIPARTIQVSPASVDVTQPPAMGSVASNQAAPDPTTASPLLWQLLAAFCGAGWIVTGVLWFRGRQAPSPAAQPAAPKASEKAALKSLQAACASNQAAAAREAVIRWAVARTGNRRITGLEDAAQALGDPELKAALSTLEEALYGASPQGWQGDHLAGVIKRLGAGKPKNGSANGAPLTLYPGR